MSLPASDPPGLSVARFRSGVGRAAALAAPVARRWLGQGAPGEYRSPFPPRLRAGRLVIVVLALLWLAAGFSGLDATRNIVRVVGHDTAPSVAAAEAIRTGLAAANADYALAMLSNEGADGVFLGAMRSRLEAVRTAIVDAAANITYGAEERGPILRILQGLGDYEDLVGRSVASAGDARRDLAFKADDALHGTALPAAAKLGDVNAGQLTDAYKAYLDRWPAWWLVAAGALLTAALVAVQIDVARTAKRLLNPGLALAALAVVAASGLVALRLLAAQSDLRVAKADAFDSVYALSSARALAADANAAQSLRLFADGDAVRVHQQERFFAFLATRLLPIGGEAALRAARAGTDPGGYLGDELANVTFPGEGEAAAAAVRAWEGVVLVDRTLLGMEQGGEVASAVASKTSHEPSGARADFSAFDAALGKVLALNQDAFTAAITSAEAADAPLGAVLVVGFVVAVAAAWVGIGRRLDEYRF